MATALSPAMNRPTRLSQFGEDQAPTYTIDAHIRVLAKPTTAGFDVCLRNLELT